MVKSATFRSKYSDQTKILYKLTPMTEKLTVETDYLPCINFNGIIRDFCNCYAKLITKSAIFVGTNNHFCSD